MITAGRALDIIEIDAATHTQVDHVREVIVETARFAPSSLRYKIFIIDEAHMLSPSAWNALLKIMEEPPAHVIFILATTEVHKVPDTIRSRCQHFNFRRVQPSEIAARLDHIAKEEKVKVAKPVLETVARLSEGCVRDAEGMLEQLLSLDGKEITEDLASLILPRTSMPLVLDLLEKLAKNDIAASLAIVGSLPDQGIDIVQFSGDILEALRRVLLIKAAGDEGASVGMDSAGFKRLARLTGNYSVQQLLGLIDTFVKAKQGLKFAAIPQLPLEVAVVEVCAEGEVRTASGEPAYKTVVRETGENSVAELSRVPDSLASKSEEGHSKGRFSSPHRHRASLDSAGRKNKSQSMQLAGIKLKWPEVLKAAQQENHSLPFLLSTSEPVAVDGDIVKLGVQYPFHCDKINEQKCRTAIEKIMQGIYSAPLRIQGVIAPRVSVREDSVDEVLRVFGGQVVD